MFKAIAPGTLEKFTTFGDLLRFLRRRTGITQVELSLAVGYSNAQISRLEQNLRPPDLPTLQARFVTALDLENEPKAVARLLELAANVRREDVPSAGLCPYKGLSYFDEDDADLFVGRETLTAKLLGRVLDLASGARQSDARLLAIVGASGSGKSSLVRAGLVPALRWAPGAVDWPIHLLSPGAHPLESLAASLTADAESVAATAALMDDLRLDSRSLHLQVGRMLRKQRNAQLVLVIDQFEELFTLCRSEVERTAFVDNLLAACSDENGSTIAVIAMRADFYSACSDYPQLRAALAEHQEYIGAMNDDELRRAIEEPASRGRWELEPGLVDQILHDVGHEPGGLPLLSHALLETWQRRRGRTLTFGGYASSGGVRGAIAETAEAVFTDVLTPEQRQVARRIFIRLTELGDEPGSGDTRRRASFQELIPRPEDSQATRIVLGALADARLITLSEDAAEVAHEALIREWPTLRGWLEEDRESLRLHRHLAEAAHEWAALGREPGALYKGLRLAQVREWGAANPAEMNELEAEFLAASTESVERETAEREAERQRALEAAQRLAATERARAEEDMNSSRRLRQRNRILRVLGAAALGLAIVAGIFGLQLRTELNTARVNLNRAESLRLAAEANVLLANGGDAQTATLLSIHALRSAYTPQADAALSASLADLYNRRVFAGHTGPIYSVAFSSDGKYALTGSQDGTARMWEAQSGEELRLFRGHKGGVAAVAISPDGKMLVTGGNDGTVRLWDAQSGRQLQVMSTNGGTSSVAFSRDGKYVLSAGAEGFARLWDVQTGKPIRDFVANRGLVSAAVFSPDGRYVATAGYDNSARLWDTATGELVRTFVNADTRFANRHMTSASFSPDGRFLLTGSDDRTAWKWDVETGDEACTFSGHSDSVNAVAFSPDGNYVVTGSDDESAIVWDSQTCQPVRRFLGHQGAVKAVAFSPDGNVVLTGSWDATARLWATPSAAPLRTLVAISPGTKIYIYDRSTSIGKAERITPGVTSVGFSPDGTDLLTAAQDGIARLWDARSGAEIRAFVGHTQPITAAAFSPDGKLVLTGSDDHTVREWDVATGRQLRRVAVGVSGVAGVAFTPSGRTFLTTSNGSVYTESNPALGASSLWDTASGGLVRTFEDGPEDNYRQSTSIAASPDGKLALLRSWGAEADLLDIATGTLICTLVGHVGVLNGVAYSPDGKYLLTAGEDKTARLWDAHTCKQLRLFTDNSSAMISVAFSPDGKYILTGQADNTAHLWEVRTGEDLRQLTGHTGIVRSVAFSPDGRFMLTGSQDGTARIWDTDYHNTIRFACSFLWHDLSAAERNQYDVAASGSTCP